MTIKFNFDTQINCVIGEYIDTVDKTQIIDALQQVYNSPDHNPKTTELWDFTACENIAISTLGFVEIANQRKSLHYFEGRIKIAIVNTTDKFKLFFYEYAVLLADLDLEFKRFSNRQDALFWLAQDQH